MKKKDLIVIVVLLIISGIGIFGYQMMNGDNETVAIYYQKELVQELDINENQVYTLEGEYGSFSLEIKDGQYRAINVECPNHNCEKVGWVKKGSSKQIVCSPNDIYIQQIGVEENQIQK